MPQAGIGSSLSDCGEAGALNCLLPPSVNGTLAAPGSQSILQNPLWWFGTPNPNAPPQSPVFTFYPLALLPAFIRPLFGWFEAINFQACFFGFTLRVGPYGAISTGFSRGCA
jgi:hypothetical protein